MNQLDTIDMTIAGLSEHYRAKDFTPRELLLTLRKTIQAHSENPVFIYLLSEAELEPYFTALEAKDSQHLPLYGIPFAIKDNIDLAGVSTTAGCPDFAYTAQHHAHVVQQLIDAGAIPVGKTNLDQFATGLVGTRSPWGPCRNALNQSYISGGSSSGSAVAVANNWVSFALGTDTAGSGRVPASLNNLVGLKPSCGLLSNSGVVAACKTIDCVSLLCLTAHDANTVFDVAAHYDIRDPFARKNPYDNGPRYGLSEIKSCKIGVPANAEREFFGNREAEQLFAAGIEQLRAIGADIVEIDFSPFAAAARLLYEGPWVVERYLTMQTLLQKSPDSILPVIRRIVEGSDVAPAGEVYQAIYRLNQLKQLALAELDKVDCIVTPTNGTAYTIEELLNDPIQLNSNLGYYTNFMNLLDFCAISVPSGFYGSEVGFGLTLFAGACTDKMLLSLAGQLQQSNQLSLGAGNLKYPPHEASPLAVTDTVDVAVCGAHLQGFPLNWQLSERGASKLCATTTAKAYRLYALAGGPPYRPGLVRDETNGEKIQLEVWRIPKALFGGFVAEIPQPLGIATLELADGSWVCGFSCEAYATDNAKDITHFGGWANYMRRES
ncbi:MAG: allophanate hydrolase [Cellvibrionaceae bacterium]|nr:allophanate hydrolase [Cellvibrionaceae bacterium]